MINFVIYVVDTYNVATKPPDQEYISHVLICALY